MSISEIPNVGCRTGAQPSRPFWQSQKRFLFPYNISVIKPMTSLFIKVNFLMQNTKLNLRYWAKTCLLVNNKITVLSLCQPCISNWVRSLIARRKSYLHHHMERRQVIVTTWAKPDLESHREPRQLLPHTDLVLFSQIINPTKSYVLSQVSTGGNSQSCEMQYSIFCNPITKSQHTGTTFSVQVGQT